MKQFPNKYIILIYVFMVAFVVTGYMLSINGMLYDVIVFGLLWELFFLPIAFGGPVLCIYALRKNRKNKTNDKGRKLTIVLSAIMLLAFLVNLYFVIAQFARSISAILKTGLS